MTRLLLRRFVDAIHMPPLDRLCGEREYHREEGSRMDAGMLTGKEMFMDPRQLYVGVL